MTSPFWSSGEHCSASFCLFPQCRSCLLSLSCCRRVRQVCAPEHGGARASAVCRFRHSLRSPPLVSASHDLRGGAGPCRRLVGVRDEQFALFCGAHHPPRDYMDYRPGAELGLLLAMVRRGSRRQSQLDSASEPLERKCVVDVHWSPENNSNSWSYTVQAGQTLHGALVYSAADDSYTLSQTVVETGETSSQVVQCQSGKKFVVLSRAFSCYTYPGRHSKCRGGSCSSAVVFLVFSNRQRSNCSCLG